MLEQHAIVLKTEGDQAWVEARESGTCGSCGSGGCSTRRLADLFGRRERAFPVANLLQVVAGERIVIGIPSGALWRAAFRLYGLPLLLVFAGAALGQYFGGDLLATAMTVLALAGGYLWQKKSRALVGWQPIMLRRASSNDSLVFQSC